VLRLVCMAARPEEPENDVTAGGECRGEGTHRNLSLLDDSSRCTACAATTADEYGKLQVNSSARRASHAAARNACAEGESLARPPLGRDRLLGAR